MDHTKELIVLAHGGDKTAREQLVKENMGLVRSVASKFAAMGNEFDDMVQLGSIGLLKCIDRFDVSMEVKFSTYAVPMIIGEIKRFLRDDGMIKISRTLKENNYKVSRAHEKLAQEIGREPTLEELSQYTGIMREDIILAKEACAEIQSIYQKAGNDDDNESYTLDKMPAGNIICQDDGAPQDEKISDVINNYFLGQVLSQLEDREQILIRLRFFEDRTQMETADILGMTQVQVSRLEKKILMELRKCAG